MASDPSATKRPKTAVTQADNWIGGEFVAPIGGKYIDVECPRDGKSIGRVAVSDARDVEKAVAAATEAFKVWGSMTVKARALVVMKLHSLIEQHAEELAQIIMQEHGKNYVEAMGDVAKGNETVEYACSLPQLVQGKLLEVGTGVFCQDTRRPLGVVASIVPFNFPLMVPLWTLPIAVACGNCLIVKPSEKVPLTLTKMTELFTLAGFPKGVINIVQGMKDAVEAIIDHPAVKAVSFVGSTKVAEAVAHRGRMLNKRVLALGGAKNHLVTMPDCNMEMAAQDIVNSYTGCTGQRCMAASVLLTVGKQPDLIKLIVEKSKVLKPGSQNRELGPVIDSFSLQRITRYIDEAEKAGTKILLDGRGWTTENKQGYWIGPTILQHSNHMDPAMRDEIFGPVLSIYECSSPDEALAIQQGNPYGNAAAVYTSSGETALWFTQRFSAGMLGVNIGVPVPREPFSFGGINASKFGDMDITGDGGVEFFSQRIKVTTKWNPPEKRTWMD